MVEWVKALFNGGNGHALKPHNAYLVVSFKNYYTAIFSVYGKNALCQKYWQLQSGYEQRVVDQCLSNFLASRNPISSFANVAELHLIKILETSQSERKVRFLPSHTRRRHLTDKI